METKTHKTITRSLAILGSLALLLSLHPGEVLNAQAAPGDTTRVSVNSSGAQANGWSRRDAITADGRYVAFMSDASNLVSGDTNGAQDVFVHDRQTGLTTRVSVDSSGNEANGGSDAPAISNDGRYVAFSSYAGNLVSGDTNGLVDIFVHDRQTGMTTRVSVASGGTEANGESSEYDVSMSGDGRYVTFYSDANNLVSGDTNNAQDVFVHDRQTGATKRVSVATGGAEGNGSSGNPNISGDSRYVAFSSGATNLVTGDTNGKSDVFVHDLQTGVTTRVSVNSSGEQADGGGGSPDISGDGRYVVFLSDSHNLAPETDDYEALVYVHDRQVGQTTLASVYSEGNIMVGTLDQPTISNEGRFVAYSYYHKGNNDGIMDIWARDMEMGGSIEVAAGNDSSFGPALAVDGSIVAFWSLASGLVSGDTNDAPDIFVREVSYGPDNDPTVASVTPDCGMYVYRCTFPTPDNVSFIVIFSEQVTGVTTDDFSLRMDEGVTGASITGVSGYGTEYFVNVDTGAGDGVLHLDVLDDDSIKDTTLNPLGGVGAGNGAFTTGHGYWVDKSIPTVTGIVRADPNPTTAESVRFTVAFSEIVYGVDSGDFTLTATGGISGASVTVVSGNNDLYEVTVATGSGDGTLRLDLLDDDSIHDDLDNPLGGEGPGNGDFSSGEIYTIARNAPLVMSILRADPNPTAAASVNFTVIFSKPVNGVDPSDFSLVVTGSLSGTSVTDLTGAGEIYTVTASTGSGEGALRLDLLDNDSITDSEGNALGGTGSGNGDFTAGESYTLDRATPSVFGILRADADPTTAASVTFTVVFSEPVNGVDTGDFSLSTTGNLTGVAINSLNGSGSSYSVSVITGSGDGTLRLDLIDNDSISDNSGYPLGGSGAGNGSYTTGESYSINRAPRNIFTSTFRSNGRNDGWVLESSEDSGVGGSFNSTSQTIYIGDSNQDAQYRAILHFPTYYLPDNAVITKAIVMVKGLGVVGNDPFSSHGNILIDIRNGAFNNSMFFWYNGLDVFDFQNPASMDAAGVIPNAPIANWYWTLLDSRAFAYINLNGVTQLRLRFEIEDDDNQSNNLLAVYSGDYNRLHDRPRFVVEYYLGR